MPTGYTADVEDGKVTTLREFALTCARAFGACIMQRDDPMSDPPKADQQPSTWNADRLAECRAELARLESMSAAESAAEFSAYCARVNAEHNAVIQKYELQKARYESMRSKVLAWKPPTDEHVGLRDFMLEQIDTSTRHLYDPSEYPPKLPESPEALRKSRLDECHRSIEYHTKGDHEERERVAGRNEWVKQLYASL